MPSPGAETICRARSCVAGSASKPRAPRRVRNCIRFKQLYCGKAGRMSASQAETAPVGRGSDFRSRWSRLRFPLPLVAARISAPVGRGSEHEPNPELYLPAGLVSENRALRTEGAAGRSLIERLAESGVVDVCVRAAEVQLVGRVVCRHLQLRSHLLRNMEILKYARIQVEETGTVNARVLQRIGPQHVGVSRGNAERRRVEIVAARHVLARITGNDVVSESGEIAGSEGQNPGNLPSSDYRVGNS